MAGTFPTTVPSYGLIESEHKHIEQIARDVEAVCGKVGITPSTITFSAGAATITVAQGRRRCVASLSQNSSLTLSTSGAVIGDVVTVQRDAAAGAWTLAVINGGAGAGTLITGTASKNFCADFFFNGTNWVLGPYYQEP